MLGIYGNGWEDFFASLLMYPAVVSQLELQAKDVSRLTFDEPNPAYLSKSAF